MKQRFSSLDVKVIAHELSASLVSLRLSNVYDLSSKILLLKFAKPDNKKQILIDLGFRCHLTEFARTTAAAPSGFVQKLRKALKTRRVTAVSQIGTDRILEFQFSDGQYRLYLEFFASGNIILTDADQKILTLMRNVPEGEGQEPQRPGLTYSLENRQNFAGVPELTKDRLRDALQTIIRRNESAAAAGKKFKKKPGDALRKGLAITINELPPILMDHAFKETGFDSTTQPAAALESDEVLDSLLHSLQEARKVVDKITSSDSCKGYILAKKRPASDAISAKGDDAQVASDDGSGKTSGLLYEDFHPFLPRQFEEDPAYTVLTFDNFNKMTDEFFSSIEGQKLESRLTEREAAAKRKLDAAKADQAKRIEGLQSTQALNIRKAEAIEANVERVQEAMDAVNGLIQQGMDWEDISKLVDRERRKGNPVASIIIPPLKLHENTITVLLGEAEQEADEGDAYETDSSESDDSDADVASVKQKPAAKRLAIDIDLGITPWNNAGDYYSEKKTAATKEQKTAQQSEMALKNAEQKIAAELKKGLKQEKPTLQPIRKQMWFEKFNWFVSSDGYLVLGGKESSQNEILYRRYLRKGDIYVHADVHGASSVVIKNNPSTPDAPIPPTTLSQAGSLAICSSSAWDSKAAMSAWYVNADQVSKSAPTGEYLPTGSFMVRGTKQFLPAAPPILGFGLVFKISDESKAKHVKHRLHDDGPSTGGKEPSGGETKALADALSANEMGGNAHTSSAAPEDSGSDDGMDDNVERDEDQDPRANPLQTAEHNREEETTADSPSPAADEMEGLKLSEEAPTDKGKTPEDKPQEEAQQDDDESEEAEDGEGDAETPSVPETGSTNGAAGKGKPPAQPAKKNQPPKRGQKGKAKKIAAKYKHQDEEDRAAAEALIGATAGKEKAEEEARIKAEKEAAQAAAKERRRAQHQRQQRETAEHEEVRKVMLEEGVDMLDEEEEAQTSALDALVGTPLAGDEILEAIAVCAPYAALSRCKYRVKLQPGAQKKGKAVKEILEHWKTAATRKGAVDENGQDKERMWPREIELIRAFKPEELFNCVPVGKLRVMLSGGAGGAGDAKGKGKGGAKARGKKR